MFAKILPTFGRCPDFNHLEMLPPSTLMLLSPIQLHILLQQDMHLLYSLHLLRNTVRGENAVVSLHWGVNPEAAYVRPLISS